MARGISAILELLRRDWRLADGLFARISRSAGWARRFVPPASDVLYGVRWLTLSGGR